MSLLSRQDVRALHDDLNKALAEVAKKHGFTGACHRMTFDDVSVRGKVEFVKNGSETVLQNRIAKQSGVDFKVGETVTCGPKTFKVVGFTPRGKIIMEGTNGKRYTAHSYQLKKAGAAPGAESRLSDNDLKAMIRRALPSINKNATNSVLMGWKWLSDFGRGNVKTPLPKSYEEVSERCLAECNKFLAEQKVKSVDTLEKYINFLNECADEAAWEASVS